MNIRLLISLFIRLRLVRASAALRKQSRSETLTCRWALISFFLFFITFLFSQCFRSYHITKDIKKENTNYTIFFSKAKYGGDNYYVVNNPSQIENLKKKLRIKQYKGLIFERQDIEFVIICINNIRYKRLSIHRSNIEGLIDSKTLYERDGRVLTKDSLRILIVELNMNGIPFYLERDTINYNFVRKICIEYPTDKHTSVNKSIRIENKISDSVEVLLQKKYPNRGVRYIGETSGGGKKTVDFNIGVANENDLKGLDNEIKESVKSIQKVTIGNMMPLKYKIKFFMKI